MEEKVEYKIDTYYCPIYEGRISDYDCQEISFGAQHGYFFNDGLPYLMPLEKVLERKELCRNCEKYQADLSCCNTESTIESMNEKLNQAIIYATEKHAGQKRKGTDIPYIVHPLETMAILKAMNADITLLIAGVLHDVVEDTDATIEQVKEMFGSGVADLVGSHSEDKTKTWKERKETDINETANGTRSLKMLVMADKVSNLRALYNDVKKLGEQVWVRFNAPVEMQAWYYSVMIEALDDMQYDTDTAEIYWEMVGLFKDIFVVFYYDSSMETIYQICISGDNYYLASGNPEWKEFADELPDCIERIGRKCAERIEDNWAEELLTIQS